MLPPAVAGIGLLVAFGRVGLLGGTFSALGIDVSFNGPRSCSRSRSSPARSTSAPAIAAFEAVDANARRRVAHARRRAACGRSSASSLPLAGGGLAAGAALSLARGLGEFGATIMFAGSLQGVTQTLPLAIYHEFDSNFDVALDDRAPCS